MNQIPRTLLAVLLALSLIAAADDGFAQDAAAPAAPGERPVTFELRDGDRVAFIGGTFFEREYNYGLIETALTLAHPDKDITFRNLGWSGDTVWGEARSYFGKPEEGYANLLADVELAKPTVIFVAYGANESFAGPEGLPAFNAQYNILLDALSKHTRRIVVFTPLNIEVRSSPLGATAVGERNAQIGLYADAIRSIAQQRQLAVVDLNRRLAAAMAQLTPEIATANSGIVHLVPNTTDGIQLTMAGYFLITMVLIEQIAPQYEGGSWGTDTLDLEAPLAPLYSKIRKKNELFFHRWRPANITYLTLFRKHEQGNNAVELAQFDPLIEQAERDIADLRAKLTSASDDPAQPAAPTQPANPGN